MLIWVDEAGRGALLGPLVICCLKIREEKIKEIESMGLRNPDGELMDSKRLTWMEREFLKRKIMGLSEEVVIKKIHPEKIDSYVKKMEYNELEAMEFMELISEIIDENVRKVIIDSPEKPNKFISRLKKYGDVSNKFIVVNKADVTYSVVACASIIAKVVRDREIIRIYEREGSIIGSGYPNRRVLECIRDIYKKSGRLPSWIRRSWRPIRGVIK